MAISHRGLCSHLFMTMFDRRSVPPLLVGRLQDRLTRSHGWKVQNTKLWQFSSKLKTLFWNHSLHSSCREDGDSTSGGMSHMAGRRDGALKFLIFCFVVVFMLHQKGGHIWKQGQWEWRKSKEQCNSQLAGIEEKVGRNNYVPKRQLIKSFALIHFIIMLSQLTGETISTFIRLLVFVAALIWSNTASFLLWIHHDAKPLLLVLTRVACPLIWNSWAPCWISRESILQRSIAP